MALTGRLTLLLTILLAIAVPSVALFSWNRVGQGARRSALVRRWTWRGAVLVMSQVGAVLLVGVLVNDTGNFYSSWRELLGEKHSVHNTVADPGNQDLALRADLNRARATGHGLVVSLRIPDTRSGIGAFTGLVYLPIQYGMPGYAHRVFPVVELIAGSPGTPKSWTNALDVANVLDREIAAGRSLPFIAVMPSQDVAGRRDTQCVDVVGGPKVETYLTHDVRAAVTHAYRASGRADSWAVMGYSSGGYCATNIAMRHPEMFAAAASIAGYARPAHDHQTGELFGRDRRLREQNTPIWRATHLPPPDVSLLLMSSTQDSATHADARAMAGAARPPLSVTLVSLRHGGHNFEVWRAEEPIAFAWVSAHLTAPLTPLPTIDNIPAVVVTGLPH
ncbi:MAG: esterase family protein [Actinomycetota bacterium]|nr:esterase family protein [Actinomycetota bacterium]